MLRCASSFVIPLYAKVRRIMGTDFKSVPARALPAAFLRSRPIFAAFKTFYEVVTFDAYFYGGITLVASSGTAINHFPLHPAQILLMTPPKYPGREAIIGKRERPSHKP
jgi:hypothetical protein